MREVTGALTVQELGKLIVHAFRASRVGRYTPLMIWGEAGVGKSQSVATAAAELGVGFKDLRLGLFEAPDLLGVFRQQEVFPCFLDYREGAPRALRGKLYTRYGLYAHIYDRHKDEVQSIGGPDQIVEWAVEEARKAGLGHLFSIRTVNAPPSWLPQPGTAGILFLDEANRAQKEVRQGSFQLVLDRQVGQIPLPSRWVIVSANNPADTEGSGMGYRVNRTDDRAFLTRFCHVSVEPTTREWLAWARRNGIDPRVRAFIAENGANYLGSTRPTKIPSMDPSPRSWAMLSNLVSPVPAEVEGAPPYELEPDLVTAVSNGLVGVEATRYWFSFRTVPDPLVTAADLLRDYETALARMRRFLRYPMYDPKTRQPMLDEEGDPVLSRRSDILRVAYESVGDELTMMAEARWELVEKEERRKAEEKKTGKTIPSERPDGWHHFHGDLHLIAAAVRLIFDGWRSEENGGLGMKDIATQYLKQWTSGEKQRQRFNVSIMVSKEPEVVQAFQAIGLDQAAIKEMIREYAAITGRTNSAG